MKKRTLIMAIAAAAVLMLPVPAKAAGDEVKAGDIKEVINSQLTESENITVKAYAGSVSKNNYISTVAINTKTDTLYLDYYATSGTRAYYKDKKVYTYDSATGKWNSKSATSSKYKLNLDIETNSVKLLADKAFRGKECYPLQIKNTYLNKSIYYVEKSSKKLLGIVTQNGSRKVITLVDTKTKVSVPNAVLKGKKTNDGVKTNESVKLRYEAYSGTKIKDKKISSYSELKSYISYLENKNDSIYEGYSGYTDVINKLKTYDSKYFKKSSLYLKHYMQGHPGAFYAVQKKIEDGKIKLVLTEYFERDAMYLAKCQNYMLFIESGKNSAKSISNVKLYSDDTRFIVPSVSTIN